MIVKGSIKRTVIPFDYNLNNPLSGYNDFRRNIKIQLHKMQGFDKASNFLRNKNLINAATENCDTGSEEISRLFYEVQQIINSNK